MTRILTAVLLIFASIVAAGAQTSSEASLLDPPGFKTDGCSLWPDGNYRDCCVEHDRAYFIGGGLKDRRKADNELFNCVRAKGRAYNKVVAPFIWFGVRIGGIGWLPTPFRWGFGNRFPAMRPRAAEKDIKK